MTDSLKSKLDGETDFVQANSYLITSPNFEKVFNLGSVSSGEAHKTQDYIHLQMENEKQKHNIKGDTLL